MGDSFTMSDKLLCDMRPPLSFGEGCLNYSYEVELLFSCFDWLFDCSPVVGLLNGVRSCPGTVRLCRRVFTRGFACRAHGKPVNVGCSEG